MIRQDFAGCDVGAMPPGTPRCPWEPVDDALQQIQAASEAGPPSRTFTILGAGVAGLAAAIELRSRGHRVRILEGSNRVGGRIHTHHFEAIDQIGELGAMRIPWCHDYTWHYVRDRYGLRVRSFHNTNDRAFFDVRNTRSRIGEFVEHILPRFADELGYSERALLEAGGPAALFLRHLAPLVEGLSHNERADLLKANLCSEKHRRLDRLTLRAWIQQHVETSGARELLDATMTMDSIGLWSLAELVRDELHKPSPSDGGLDLCEIIGGFEKLPRAMEAELEGCIELGCTIEEIHVKRDEVRVCGTRRGGGRLDEGIPGPVLCTLPFPVLRHLRVTGVSDDKTSAIRRMSYASSTKVLVACNERIWETRDGIFGGRSISDRVARQTYYPSDNARWNALQGGVPDIPRWSFLLPGQVRSGQLVAADPQASRGPGVLLASYTWNNDARSLANRSPDDAVDVVLADLERLHPGIRSHVVDAVVMPWDRNPWSRGAFAVTPPGDLEDHASAARRPEGRLAFAGEHLSIAPGWIQGALQSALVATRQMLRMLPVCLVVLAGLAPDAAEAKPRGEWRQPADPDELAYQTPPEAPPAREGHLDLELRVAYGLNEVAGEPVWLRSYNGGLVGPTIRIRPGQTLNVDLLNRLPPTPGSQPPAGAGHGARGHGGHGGHGDPNVPHGFNVTNLHTHGLWVSPTGNSDNVLLSVFPGEDFRNEIVVPRDHPPGSHWYHAHRHGSVALQVSSGMAGLLIVQGGLDDVPAIAEAEDTPLVFQQVYHSRRDCRLQGDGPDVRPPRARRAGCIETYRNLGPGSWPFVDGEERFTTINGLAGPTLTLAPGEVRRFRAVHAGVNEALHLAIVKVPESRRARRRFLSQLNEDVTGAEGFDAPLGTLRQLLGDLPLQPVLSPMYEIAADGIAFGRVDAHALIELQPGYRSDFLTKIDQTGLYALVDVPSGDRTKLRGELPADERGQVLAWLRVEGDRVEMALPTNADVADLAPYPPVEDREIASCQDNVFNIVTGCDEPARFTVDDQAFDPDATPRLLPLHRAEEWRLLSKFGNHPFHIHVNPFEVQPNEALGIERPVWRDTFLVRGPPGGRYARSEQELRDLVLTVRTRYRRYVGRYVLHCHLLDHEDQGMMQEVEVQTHPPTTASVDCAKPLKIGRFPGGRSCDL